MVCVLGDVGKGFDRNSLLGRQSTAPGTHDSTVYGEARASTRAYFRHHAGAISAAVVLADATTVLNAAASLSFGLTFALPCSAM